MKKIHFDLSMRSKVMLTMCTMIISVLLLFTFAVNNLMQPAYNRFMYRSLDSRVEKVVSLFDEAAGNGEDISSRTLFGLWLNSDFWERVNKELSDGNIRVDGCCLDIADTTLRSVNFVENLQPCVLHESGSYGRMGSRVVTEDRNSTTVVELRQKVFREGNVRMVMRGSVPQMVVGRLTADGKYSIILSTELTRIHEAGVVMQELLPSLAFVLLILAVIASWALSRWITAPLTRLSTAARKVAAGDYDICLPTGGGDEMSLLAQDFNYMAQEVKKSSLMQRQLLANVSHDLRTPLTLIKGYAETVRDISGEDKLRRDEQMNIIIDETDRLSGLVNSVMEYSKVTSGTEKPEKVRFDMSQLCDEVAERYEGICAQKGWTLETQLQPAMVYADPAMMERVLHNLLGNAANHMGEDRWFCLRVLPLAEGGCRVEVSDHGPGIKAEDMPHLFDRYYRSRSDSGKIGTGLGLSITKAIFQSHTFRFGVDSTPGQGSTFWFIMRDDKPVEKRSVLPANIES